MAKTSWRVAPAPKFADSAPEVVISGLGAITSYGLGMQHLWRALEHDSVADTSTGVQVSPSRSTTVRACVVPTFDHKRYLRLRPPYPARFSQLALIATSDALTDAALTTPNVIDRTRIGAVWATEFGPNATVQKYLTTLMRQGAASVSPIAFAASVTNVAAGDVARYFQFRGASSVIAGDSSISYGYDLIRSGKADVVVCGGVDELQEVHRWAFAETGKSVADDAMTPALYSREGRGVLLGEGAGVVILESAASASARGIHCYAKVSAYGQARDRAGSADLLTCRGSIDMERSLRNVVSRVSASSSEPLSIGAIFGAANTDAGTSAPELDALERLTGKAVPVTGLKSHTGEAFAASGIINVAVACQSLRVGMVPSSRSVRDVPPTLPEPIVTHRQALAVRTCIASSIHVGGNNTSIFLDARDE